MRPLIRQIQINQAVECLKKGGLVAIPTETVYGLAADASNEIAVRKIFAAKGRPVNHPLIVHIADIQSLAYWAKNIPEYAYILAEKYWPGPMTLILKKQPHVLDAVTGGQDSVGIRVPNHPVAQQLLQTFGGGLAAPSANRFGYISPTSAEHVRQDLGDQVDMILDGGNSGIGIESTIIDCTGETPRILRPGMISEKDIFEVIANKSAKQTPLTFSREVRTMDGKEPPAQDARSREMPEESAPPRATPRVSGTLLSHYAPRTKTQLFTTEKIDALIQNKDLKNIVILSMHKPKQHHVKIYDSRIPHRALISNPDIIHWIVMPSDPYGYAHRLYEQLHFADHLNCEEIWVEAVPDTSEWSGIRDRIMKATY